ncbi:MAG: argininosuccinate lyase [Dehalococcoidia bacterium]|nr:argininosuccinate lyase [Dehalococcoidia bacterium]
MSHIRSRFSKEATEAVVRYTSSLSFDRRLYPQDIAGSIAHARMLGRQGIISPAEAEALIQGLDSVNSELAAGRFEFRSELEDIHMAIESRLLELIGPVAGKLHTARSRNDQVSLDLRLYVKEAIQQTLSSVRNLQKALVAQAESHRKTAMPGYTHLQPAQPVLLAHHLLAYFEMLERDYARFADTLKRTDVLPLGSGALAGAAYDLDRAAVAAELGFAQVSRNSLDAVADRDFVLEYLAAASICMSHLSRLAEELVLWSSAEFGFVRLDDAYTTGSSIMPQKKNPDVAELGRGKAGRVFGHLLAMLTTLKGLPLAYNRDLQEDKEALFDAVDTLLLSLEVFSGMISTAQFQAAQMKRALVDNGILATDLADYLVKKGLPFREAHGVVGRLVSYAETQSKPLRKLSLAEYQLFSPLFDDDARRLSLAKSLAARSIPGGTAPKQVARQIWRAKKILGIPCSAQSI